MRIQHNIMAMNAYRNYNTNTSALAKNLEKLSSGYKINRAGDDAAGLAISEKMRAQITGLTMATKNAKDGVSMVQTAEGALTEVHDMLNRMVELATQAANGTYDENDRASLQEEFNALRTEIDRIGSASNFNGTNMFTTNAVTFQIGETDTVANQIAISVGILNSTNLGQITINGAVATASINGIGITSQSVAQAAISVINTAIKAVSATRGRLGAVQNRLEHTINNLGVMTENIQDAESNIRDTDIADEMMAYTKNNILIQSAQAMLAQANQVPQGVLQLLQ